jgi:hypothetical protein
LKLPYTILPVQPDTAFPQRSAIRRPIVALLLQKNNHSLIAYAVADTGADLCVFPASFATALGILIPTSRVSVFSGSGDLAQTAYFEQVQATILPMDSPGIEPDQEPITFPLFVGFCETLEHLGMGLLGQEGFFSQYQVTFHNAQSYFEIR